MCFKEENSIESSWERHLREIYFIHVSLTSVCPPPTYMSITQASNRHCPSYSGLSIHMLRETWRIKQICELFLDSDPAVCLTPCWPVRLMVSLACGFLFCFMCNVCLQVHGWMKPPWYSLQPLESLCTLHAEFN